MPVNCLHPPPGVSSCEWICRQPASGKSPFTKQKTRRRRIHSCVLIIVLASLLGLVVMGIFGLLTTKKTMMVERQAQITLLLDFADAQLRYYHSQEVAGRYSREEA